MANSLGTRKCFTAGFIPTWVQMATALLTCYVPAVIFALRTDDSLLCTQLLLV